jgi:hypothetical protein
LDVVQMAKRLLSGLGLRRPAGDELNRVPAGGSGEVPTLRLPVWYLPAAWYEIGEFRRQLGDMTRAEEAFARRTSWEPIQAGRRTRLGSRRDGWMLRRQA